MGSGFRQFRSFCLQVLSLLLPTDLTHEILLNKGLYTAQPPSTPQLFISSV